MFKKRKTKKKKRKKTFLFQIQWINLEYFTEDNLSVSVLSVIWGGDLYTGVELKQSQSVIFFAGTKMGFAFIFK